MRSNTLSLGSWIILALACLSSIALFFIKDPKPEGQAFWLFSKHHQQMYEPYVLQWNNQATETKPPVNLTVISTQALERRLLSGFLSDTPVPDLVEVEIGMAARFFAGPEEAIGFIDLNDRIKSENLDEHINAPSFTPWTRNGKTYGLPHDMHPVLLGYRADIIEAAGIDVS
jgi:arabinosaccharide transport system substrate-binding protein